MVPLLPRVSCARLARPSPTETKGDTAMTCRNGEPVGTLCRHHCPGCSWVYVHDAKVTADDVGRNQDRHRADRHGAHADLVLVVARGLEDL